MLSGHAERGTTLVELLAVMVLLAAIGAVILHVTVSQERFLDAVGRVIETRRVVREGADIPRQDLRAVAPASGGIYSMAADRVEFRSAIGASVLCTVDSSRTGVSIPARDSWSALTSWVASPREGDTVLVFDSEPDSEPPRWLAHALAADPAAGGACPVSSGFARTVADEPAALGLQLTKPLEPGVGTGAAIRFVRPARYQLYHAGDGEWYLGYLDCLSSRAVPCGTIQPVSGPFAAAGIRLLFLDSAGVETSDPDRVVRIDVMSRAVSGVELRAAGFARGRYSDSVVASIALRNR